VADPAAPVALGGVLLADGSRDLAVDGDVVYAAVGWSGLQVIDVADPAAPRIVGAFALPSVTHAVGVGADRLWLTAAYVHTAPLHCPAISAAGEPPPASALALNAWPNPFNPRTTLAFELPAAAPVSLVVYDLAGRRVRTLAAGEVLGAGAHTRTWLGRDDRGRAVASGVYLYRLEAGAQRATRRVTLIR
jgi:hypothetical protein